MRLEHCDQALGYRYDCYWTDGRRNVALEVFNTHACTEEKLRRVKQSGLVLAEFHAQEIKDKLLDITPGKKVWLNNLQTQKIMCASCTGKVIRQEQVAAWRVECEELQMQARRVEDEYYFACPVRSPERFRLQFGKFEGCTVQQIDWTGLKGIEYLYSLIGCFFDSEKLRMIDARDEHWKHLGGKDLRDSSMLFVDAMKLKYPGSFTAVANYLKKRYGMHCLDCKYSVRESGMSFCKLCSEHRIAEEKEAKRLEELASLHAKRIAEQVEREAKRVAEEAEREAKRVAEAAERRAMRVAEVEKEAKQAILLAWQNETAEIQLQEMLVENEYCSHCPRLFPEYYRAQYGKHKGKSMQEISTLGWFEGTGRIFWMAGYIFDRRKLKMVKNTTEIQLAKQQMYHETFTAAGNFIRKRYFMRCLDCGKGISSECVYFCSVCHTRRSLI